MDEFGHDGSSGEFGRFVNICLTIFLSITYCYFISRNTPKGFPRLLSILPIIYIFTIIPLKLSSFHLTTGTGFLISWLANFKLVLFSFDKGPLSSDPTPVSSSSPSPMTFLRFIGITCLPIKVKQSNRSTVPSCTRQHMHGMHCYVLEARNLFGIDVDPPFGNYFFLSTSFQDFWGRRWNLMVSSILRSFVHEPVRHIIRRSWGLYVAIIVTFFVSGLMHELLIFYVFRKQPCWDVLVFFILNGICLAVEMKVKKSLNGKWQLNQLFSILLTNGFLVCSSFWLLFPFLEKFKFRVLVMEEMANFTKLLHNVLVDPIVRSYLNASHMHETETNVSYGVI
ncbi:probable long-chain-alcohol O-fatty-acyltransferase 5 isoform X1 [Papaver somniferum]|uniref:probable long-chain-alcohol O-fatty-acyltransferase 5 isoform X1 n=1 Tax=Papaver somniferum TaxID=3469 RepID=UPI000E6FAF69|nr:probable long-chain-alcohol O-fatty-acyltransferase 5 isoform X1 [Papaver somniferum]